MKAFDGIVKTYKRLAHIFALALTVSEILILKIVDLERPGQAHRARILQRRHSMANDKIYKRLPHIRSSFQIYYIFYIWPSKVKVTEYNLPEITLNIVHVDLGKQSVRYSRVAVLDQSGARIIRAAAEPADQHADSDPEDESDQRHEGQFATVGSDFEQ